jgi:glycosyltransferase involved in cell wall biosynthesis
VRNGEAYVRQAIESVLHQIKGRDEVLVIDDQSTDATRSMIGQIDSRVIALEGPGRGPSAARNIGLSQARGEFIAFLDHDDLWPQGRHDTLLAALLADDEANAAVGRMRVIAEAGAAAGPHAAMSGLHVPAILPSCLYRHDLVMQVGPFAEDMRHGEDVDYHFRLAESGLRLAFCATDSLIYRRHDRNTSLNAPPGDKVLLATVARRLERRRNLAQTNPIYCTDPDDVN